MAEQELAPQMEPGAEAVPETVAPEVPSNEPPADDPVAHLARDLGWRPKEEFRGNPDDWKPADQFIRDGRDIQRTMTDRLKGMEDTMTRMTSASEMVMQRELAKQRAEILAERDTAIENGDKARVYALDKDLGQIPTAMPQSEPTEVHDFKARNDWFGRDQMASNFAYQVCEQNKHLSQADQLRLAEAEVKKRFPEHFPAPAKQPPQVSAPQARNGQGSSRAKGFNDMPREAQAAAIKFEENHGVSREDYTKRFWASQEKVG